MLRFYNGNSCELINNTETNNNTLTILIQRLVFIILMWKFEVEIISRISGTKLV